MWKNRTVLVVAVATSLALAGCSASTKNSTQTSTSTEPKATTINVLAASSLTEIFPKLATEFQAAHPGVTVKFSYGGSSTLAQQIVQGAPADVFAAASPATMKTVTDAGDADGTPQNFVSNQLVIAVPPGNPKNITSLAGLTKPGLKVVLCAPAVPCGAAAATALTAGGVKLTPVSLEQDVKSALSKVELGEADAALVYRTDAKSAAGKVDAVEFPESAKAINEYPIAALKSSKSLDVAHDFVTFILSPAVLTEMEAAGFQAPQ
jgi:molybdate transport system substrate-binding protein